MVERDKKGRFVKGTTFPKEWRDIWKEKVDFTELVKNLGRYAKKGCISPTKLNLDEKEIIRLFTKEKKNCTEIGKIFNCSNVTIQKRLNKNNISTSQKGRPKSKESIKKLIETKNSKIWKETIGKISFQKQSKTMKKLYKEGKIKSWCEGLTKKTDNRLRKIGEKRSELIKGMFKGEKNPFYGKNHPFNSRKKISATKQGISLEEWKEFTGNLPYDSKFSKRFKRLIRKRDNYICMKCLKHQEKEGKSLSIHHINYDKQLTIPQNCVSLCNRCNAEVNKNRKHWIKLFQSLLAEKYDYQYSEIGEIILNLNNYAQLNT